MQDTISDRPLEALAEIKKMMQQSTRVFSLSGWSGVWAGCVALLGAYVFYLISLPIGKAGTVNTIVAFTTEIDELLISDQINVNSLILFNINQKLDLLWASVGIFIVAVLGAIFFTFRKNKLQGHASQYNLIARKLLINLCIPIVVGAIFCLHFLYVDALFYLVPCSLVFYGLGLINSSKYTFSDIKYLGLLEVILGLLALFLMKYHLVIWALGFGVLHIAYGIIMWLKYDRK